MIIEIYSSDNCHYCKEAKEYFSSNGIEFNEYNISENREARRNLMKKGVMSVPYIIIGEHSMLGFNKDKVEEILKSEG